MIYIILFAIIIAISAFLALRSMKSFQDIPASSLSYTLFLIRNPKSFTPDTLSKLYSLSLASKSLFSLEVLLKGTDRALGLFLPTNQAQSFPELSLLEIEDYLDKKEALTGAQTKITVNEVYAWTIQPKNNPKKLLSVSPQFMNMIDLGQNQKFFWQIVATPIKNSTIEFQVTIRSLVADPDPIKRVELAKTIDKEIESGTGLIKSSKTEPTISIFESYQNRTISPKEVSPFILQPQEIYDLLGKITH